MISKKNSSQKLQYHREEFINFCAINNETEIQNGLQIKAWGNDEGDREELKKQFGDNKIIPKKFNHFKKLFFTLFSPFNVLLWSIAIIQLIIYLTNKQEIIDLVSVIIILFMIFLASIVDYIQDYKAFKMNTDLNQMIENNVYILNKKVSNFHNVKIPELINGLNLIKQSELTQGDVIYLSAGDQVPADGRILWDKNLFVDQSSFTGEAELISKRCGPTIANENIFNLENIIYQNSKVSSGQCFAVILNVGENTYSNAMLKFNENSEGPTEYEIGLKKVTKIILLSLLFAFPLVFLLSFWKSGLLISSLIFAISLVVSITPESLPAIMTLNLHEGAKRLRQAKIVAKNNATTQSLGAVDLLCTDKTGTLTNSNITITDYKNFQQENSLQVFWYAYLNAYNQSNIANNIDIAILDQYPNKDNQIDEFNLLLEKPFTHDRRLVSVLLNKKTNQKFLQITKGSFEEILRVCKFVFENNKIRELTPSDHQTISENFEKIFAQGFRCIGVAFKEFLDINDFNEADCVYMGAIIFKDEVKPEVKSVIELLYKNNVDLKILTGDSQPASQLVANQVGILNPKAIQGEELAALKKADFAIAVQEQNIFCKLTPFQKAAVVEELQNQGHCVAFIGDGVNDSPALRQSDVGISVNNAAAVAKASSDAIMLEKDLLVLEKALLQGRHIFSNAIKYIKISVANNFSLMLTLIIALIWLDFQPMAPIHLLFQNLLYDFTNLIFVWDSVDSEVLIKPRKWSTKSILPFGLYNGLVATIISIINFAIIGYGFNLIAQINGGSELALKQFQAAFFLESFLTHMLLSLVYRTQHLAFFKSNPPWKILAIIGFFTIITFSIIFLPNLNGYLGFAYPPLLWLALIPGLLIFAWLLGELSKFSYQMIFKTWL
ncbi:Mg(2+) transport ATPase, P-type [Spiroplasma sabaudiense Ar-1343]|uniref:Mg(2+) transport ATPase, P-type n=1 Tax=Spiroplasma sabaudiense Ar-1343 TaxID=1276257 RepID=W6AJN9_9MOLU|nr:HAD-IC family P-type ATPase [Spiroplasma sabaudiense]AHI53944.1 Mg(2+) transport ATPase, P-type [Spiroplasma sabaudiense Ar-1343]